jgi:glycerol-3-phosphate acyltransferase PlsY
MTVHREQNMKREDQQDAAIICLILTSVSTCFGHHYAHLQENKGHVTAFGVLFWFCWMWLVAVVGRCVVGCEHNLFQQVSGIIMPIFRRTKALLLHLVCCSGSAGCGW